MIEVETTNLFISKLLGECGFLEGSYIQKIQFTPQGWLKFKLNTTKGTKDFILTSKVFVLAEYKIDAVHQTTGFAQWLNKHIRNRKILKVCHSRLDRVIELELEDKTVVLELFGKGNVIVLDKENVILGVKSSVIGKTRKIKRNESYTRLETDKKIDTSALENAIKEEKNLKKELTRRGIPLLLSEDVLISFGNHHYAISKDKEKEYYERVIEFFLENPAKKAYLYEFKDKKYILPTKLNNFNPIQKFKSAVSAANEIFLVPELKIVKKEIKTSQKTDKFEAMKVSLEKQEKIRDTLQTNSEEFKKIGELIYSNYVDLQNAIQFVNETKDEELMYKKQFGKLKIVNLDKKNKKIELELEK